MSALYSREEVSKHNDEKNLWVIIHNGVYDVTRFLKEHPGGEEVLLNLAGKDGTVCFDEIGHSQEALLLREQYKVGDIIESEKNESYRKSDLDNETSVQSGIVQEEDDWEYEEKKEETSPWLPIFIGLGVVVYGIIFYYIF